MIDLSNFRRGHIVDDRRTGNSVTQSAKIFGVSWCIFWKVLTASEKEGKTSYSETKPRKQIKTFQWGPPFLTWIIRKDHKITTPEITLMNTSMTQSPQNCSLGTVKSRVSWEGCNKKTPTFKNERGNWNKISQIVLPRAAEEFYILGRGIFYPKRSIWLMLLSSNF